MKPISKEKFNRCLERIRECQKDEQKFLEFLTEVSLGASQTRMDLDNLKFDVQQLQDKVNGTRILR